ncbi:MAG: hypothetical protein KGL25_07730, partial [Gammaproteobacteria bacterium]|nr:hypothetical protein [Gammaproteobacteria bacterium]
MRRLLHTSWISLLALALLVAGACYYIGWTESGLQRLVALSNRRLGHVTLQIDGARGTLHEGVHIDRLVVDHPRVHIVADQLDGRVALLPLLWQTIRVAHLRIAAIRIHVLPHAAAPGAPWQPHFLYGLLNIQAEDLAVAHAELISPSGASLAADRLRAVAQVGNKQIRVFDGALQYAGFDVRATGSVRAAAPIQLQGGARFSLEAPGKPAWLADAQFEGDLDRLLITGALLAPFNADFQGEARALSGDWHWQGVSQVRDFDLRAWGLGGMLGAVHGTLGLSGNRHGFGVQGTLDPPGLAAGPLAVDFAGRYAARVLEVSHLVFLHRASGARLSAAGQVGIVAGGPRLDLHGDWQQFCWPLDCAHARVRSSAGSYTLAGLKPYALSANGALQLLAMPRTQFRATGRIEHSGLDLHDLALDAFGGHAQLRAAVEWSPHARWSAAGSVRGLDIASLRPAIRGRLDFNLDASGLGFGAGRSLQAKFTAVGGNVRGQRASGQAGITLAGNDWLLQQVRLQLGATRLEADGRLGAHPDLRFAIDASDLALLRNGARGQLRAAGHLRGDLRNPLLLARVSGAGIHYDGLRLQALRADVNFEPQGNGRADVDLELEHFSAGARRIEHLGFTTRGTAAAHHYALDMRAPPYRVQAGGGAQFSDGIWHAAIDEFSASDGTTMHLALGAPASLSVALDGTQLELRDFCLHDAVATLCAMLARLPGGSRLALHAANVPLRALTAGLSTDTDFDGRVSLDAQAAAAGATAPWTGSINGALAEAAVRHHLSGGRLESFSLGNGTVRAQLDAGGLSASVGLDAGAA